MNLIDKIYINRYISAYYCAETCRKHLTMPQKMFQIGRKVTLLSCCNIRLIFCLNALYIFPMQKAECITHAELTENVHAWSSIEDKYLCMQTVNMREQRALESFEMTFQMVFFSLSIKTLQQDASSQLWCKPINKLLSFSYTSERSCLRCVCCLQLSVRVISHRLLGSVFQKHTCCCQQ